VFLIAGASRLARFQYSGQSRAIQSGAAGEEVFVGHANSRPPLGVLASVVHFTKGEPVEVWWQAVLWCVLLVSCSF